jgi:hypothetical protein
MITLFIRDTGIIIARCPILQLEQCLLNNSFFFFAAEERVLSLTLEIYSSAHVP